MESAESHDHPPMPGAGSWIYMLERFDVGLVQLDLNLTVIGMNEFARKTLPVADVMPFGQVVTAFHPGASRAKVEFMIKQSNTHADDAPPMTMIINIPERMLLIKVSRIAGEHGVATGYMLVFHDITDVISHEPRLPAAHGNEPGTAVPRRLLRKIPTSRQGRVLLIDIADVSFIRSDGHYTWVHTAQGGHFCNLNIGDLEARLDPNSFIRVHRSYIVNLLLVSELIREDGRITLRMKSAPANDVATDIPVSRSSSPALLEQLGLVGVAHLNP